MILVPILQNRKMSLRFSDMLKVIQLVNGSIKYPNSILSHRKTYIVKPVVLKHKPASESWGGLVTIQIAGPHPRVFDSVGLG